MSCERCIDIHKAQAVGITGTPCKCKCHDYSIGKTNITTGTSADPASVTYLNMTGSDGNSTGTTNVKINSDGTFN